MSSKRKQSTLSQSSHSESDNSDTGARGNKSGSGSSSNSDSDGGKSSPRKSRSRSGSKMSVSDSGSGGGGGRSRSSSGSGRSKSGSRSPVKTGGGKSGSDSGSGSSGRKSSASPANSSPKKGAIYSSSDSKQSSRSSSGSEKSKKLKKASDHRLSASLAKSLSSNSDSEEEEAAKAKPLKKIPKKKAKHDSSEDEIEDWRKEFDDGLDDQLIGDEEDRAKLEDMTEREREEELFKRAEQREELKKRFEISRKLRLQQKNKKESSSEGEIKDDKEDREERGMGLEGLTDPTSRKKGYEEKYGKKFSALSELKAKREEKERKEREKKNKKGGEKRSKNLSDSDSGSDYEKLGRKKKKKVLKASEIYSSTSSEGEEERRRSSSSSSSSSESDGESDTERHDSKKTVKKAQNIKTVADLERIRLSRFKLDKFCHLPIFKKTVVGCFVKVGIGKDQQKNKDVYRCCEVMDVCETGKVYNVMKTKTNAGLKLRHGKDTRVFRLQFVSNTPLTDSEFERWRYACDMGNIELPTVAHVEQKEKEINYALSYRFSSADVEKIIASKSKFNTKPKNYAMYKAKLMKERDYANTYGDSQKAEDLTKRLEEIETMAEELDRKRTSTISAISLINNRNRKGNLDRAYEGIKLEEKRKAKEGEVSDPFTRRKTKPVLSKLTKNTELVENNGVMEEVKKAPVQVMKTPQPRAASPDPKKKKTAVATAPSIDIFDAHNFDLDINVDESQVTPLTPAINLKPVTASANPAGPTKKLLKLEEWKKKRGIL